MSAAEAIAEPKPSRSSRLLGVVRQLIYYGRQLVTTLRDNPRRFGAGEIALILQRVTRGLLRAEALEARVIRDAARLDAWPVLPPTSSHRASSPAGTAAARPAKATQTHIAGLPTEKEIAAEVRRRPIGAVIADICRDLGITPYHPLWTDLSAAILRHGGNLPRLWREIYALFRPRPTADRPLTLPAPALPSLAPAATGPPS
jgi:hypothetical protein